MGVQAIRAARETVFMKVGVKIGFGSTVLNLGLGSSGINGIGQYTQQFGDSLSGRDDIELVEWFFGDSFNKASATEAGSFERKVLKSLLLGRNPFGCGREMVCASATSTSTIRLLTLRPSQDLPNLCLDFATKKKPGSIDCGPRKTP